MSAEREALRWIRDEIGRGCWDDYERQQGRCYEVHPDAPRLWCGWCVAAFALAAPAPAEPCRLCGLRPAWAGYWCKPCFENSLLPREQSAAPVDDRERVPEGWRVEWHEIEPGHENCVLCIRWSKVPTLVPVSPSVDPGEG